MVHRNAPLTETGRLRLARCAFVTRGPMSASLCVGSAERALPSPATRVRVRSATRATSSSAADPTATRTLTALQRSPALP